MLHTWQGQPNLTVIGLFPLMAYLVLRWDGSLTRTWCVSWLALAMALQFYTFTENFAEMTAVLAGGLGIGFAVALAVGPHVVVTSVRHTYTVPWAWLWTLPFARSAEPTRSSSSGSWCSRSPWGYGWPRCRGCGSSPGWACTAPQRVV